MQEQPKDDLEYNDGLGDLLREKEKLEFNWIKTGLVLVGLVGVIFLFLTLIFNAGKTLLTSNQEPSSQETRRTLEEIEKENQALLAELEEVPVPKVESKKPLKPTLKVTAAKNTPSSTQPVIKVTVYKVIAGAYGTRKSAEVRVADLKKRGIESFVTPVKTDKGVLYRVQAGAFKSKDLAESFIKELKAKGIQDCYSVRSSV